MNTTYKLIATVLLAMSMSAPALAAEAAAGQESRHSGTAHRGGAANSPLRLWKRRSTRPFRSAATSPRRLKDLVRRMAKARDDQAVKAVVLLLENASLATSQVEELRQAIAEVRKAGKDVYAHADGLDMPGFALLAGSTHLSVVPTGDVWLTGLHGESMYLRGLFNKLGVTPDFLTCGEYKSAAETYMREGPSVQAEEMQNWLLDSIFVTQLRLMAHGRGVDTEKVRQWIDGGPYTARRAKELGIIDAADERQDLENTLKKRFGDQVQFDHKYGATARPQIDFTSPFAAFEIFGEILGAKHKKAHKTSVAIVYVDGPIMLGEPANDSIFGGSAIASSTALRRALDEAAADDTIKAVVLRGQFARRLGYGQRCDPGCHAAGESPQAAGSVDGPGGSQRRLLRDLCRRNHLRRRSHHYRLDWRVGRQAGHDRHVEQDRRQVQIVRARQASRLAQFGHGVQSAAAETHAGLDG